MISFYGLMLTIGCFLIVILFELLLYCCKSYIKQKKQLYSYIKCSLICFFLTAQPGVLQNALKYITCREVNNKQYSLGDSNILCDSDFYKNDILPINIGVLAVLGLIIPLMIGFWLYQGNKSEKIGTI